MEVPGKTRVDREHAIGRAADRRGSQHMNVDEIPRESSQSRRRRCACCGEPLDPEDRRSLCLPGRGSSGWLCSEACLDRFRRQAAGEEVEPYYGEQLEQGFRMRNDCHGTEW
jgi:hypothetical protein